MQNFQKSLSKLNLYNAHYCIAPQNEITSKKIVKPFTKGFTAATIGAIVVVNRQVEDSEFLLGEDYPYFVDECKDDQINEILDKVESTFLKNEWNVARQRMKNIAEMVQPKFLAGQMMEIARELHSCPALIFVDSASCRECDGSLKFFT